jgi:hypothetical protein
MEMGFTYSGVIKFGNVVVLPRSVGYVPTLGVLTRWVGSAEVHGRGKKERRGLRRETL